MAYVWDVQGDDVFVGVSVVDSEQFPSQMVCVRVVANTTRLHVARAATQHLLNDTRAHQRFLPSQAARRALSPLRAAATRFDAVNAQLSSDQRQVVARFLVSVSYTHLTLPTICSV